MQSFIIVFEFASIKRSIFFQLIEIHVLMYGVAYCRKYIFTSYTIQILCWHFFTTYFEVIVAATLGKRSHSKWYLNEAMTSGSFAPRKVKNLKQHDLFVLSLYIWLMLPASLLALTLHMCISINYWSIYSLEQHLFQLHSNLF